MKLTDEIYNAFEQGAYGGPNVDTDAGLQAVLDLLDPIPARVEAVYDRGEMCWRRSVDDPAVWTTAARSRVATGRVLLDVYGPLKWRDANGNEDLLGKMNNAKGTFG